MIAQLDLHALAEASQGQWFAGDPGNLGVSSVVIDSREVKPGSVFIALSGAHFDGHEFVQRVEGDGAVAAIVSSPQADAAIPQLVVEDVSRALASIAALNVTLSNCKKVAITGSAGKTTCKNIVSQIAKAAVGKEAVCATKGNFNNEIGLPLTALNINDSTQYAILEMGAAKMGDIHYLCEVAKPDIALVTNINTAHIEGFGSVEITAAVKGEVYRALSDDGIAVINRDERFAEYWLSSIDGPRIIDYSFSDNEALVYASNIVMHRHGTAFKVVTPEYSIVVKLPLLGMHNISNVLAAVAIAYALNLSKKAIAEGIGSVKTEPRRLELRTGFSQSCLIDDTYNANPEAVCAAVDVLSLFEGDTVLVLGDMLELGKNAEQYHEEVGRYAKKQSVSRLIAVGELAAHAANAFGAGAIVCETHQRAIDELNAIANPDLTVLIKGSRGSNMDTVADGFAILASIGSTETLSC